MEEATIYAWSVPTSFVYIAVGAVVIGIGVYLYKKLKSKK